MTPMWQAATTAPACTRRPDDGLDAGDPRSGAVVVDQQPGGAVAEHHPAAVGLQPAAQRRGQPAGAADGVAGRDVVQQRDPADHGGGAGLGHRRAGLGAEPGQRRLEPLAAEPAVQQGVAGAEEVDGQLAAGGAGAALAGAPSGQKERTSPPALGRRPNEATTARLRGPHTATNRR